MSTSSDQVEVLTSYLPQKGARLLEEMLYLDLGKKCIRWAWTAGPCPITKEDANELSHYFEKW